MDSMGESCMDIIHSHLEELKCMKECDPDVLIADLINNQQKIKMNDALYYNEEQDKLWKEHYYCNVTTDSTDSLRLYHDFSRLVTNTHQYKLPYYISKDQYLYTWVDLQPNGKLKCIYSGNRKDPQKLIEEDFEVIERRFIRYRDLIKSQRYSKQRINKKVKNISKQHKFNTEHVVPQSWYRAKEPMKGDLHHLFACEPRCNTMRSNYPYYHYDNVTSRHVCGINRINGFEPTYGKGVVARAALYFLLRYPKQITKRFRKTINVSLLLRWHEEYEVSEYEKHRNKAIYEIQGNRNPFIDFPELMTNITFPN